MTMAGSVARRAGWAILAAAVIASLTASAGAADPGPPPGSDAAPTRPFDWLAHTRETLDTLKGLLHLDGDQNTAWDTWSGGVLQDANRQLARKPPDKARSPHASPGSETTPAQMARGIAHLQAGLERMQAQVHQLEAAQARTQTFYDALDIKQRTVFDLYWHEVRHRVSGDDDDGDPHAAMRDGDGMHGRMAGAMRGDGDMHGAMMHRSSECADDGRMP